MRWTSMIIMMTVTENTWTMRLPLTNPDPHPNQGVTTLFMPVIPHHPPLKQPNPIILELKIYMFMPILKP